MEREQSPIVALAGGAPIEGASVLIKVRSTGADATVYAAETGGAAGDNPDLTDEYGTTNQWLERGAYQAVITADGLAPRVVNFSIAPGSDGGVDEDWLVPGLLGVTLREVHTWAVGGEIKVPASDTDYIPPMFASKLAGETLTLKKLRVRINGGTSVTFKVQQNGSDVTGYTGLSATTTAGDVGSGDVAIADDDVLAIVVTAVTGTPKNLTVTAVFERAVA